MLMLVIVWQAVGKVIMDKQRGWQPRQWEEELAMGDTGLLPFVQNKDQITPTLPLP